MVLFGWISRSRGQKLGFQNAIFKNLLVWKYKAKSFHIWCITSSRGPLPIFGVQHKWSTVNGSTVTFDLFLRWATQGPLGPLVYQMIQELYRCCTLYHLLLYQPVGINFLTLSVNSTHNQAYNIGHLQLWWLTCDMSLSQYKVTVIQPLKHQYMLLKFDSETLIRHQSHLIFMIIPRICHLKLVYWLLPTDGRTAGL